MEYLKFTAPIEHMNKGMNHQVVFLPGDVVEQLSISGKARIIGSANGLDYRRAALSDGNGRYYMIFGKDFLKKGGLVMGQQVDITIALDPEPDRVDIPEELEAAMEFDEDAAKRFYGFTPGKQRSLCIYVSQSKREETRIKRALELCEKMRTYTLHGDKTK